MSSEKIPMTQAIRVLRAEKVDFTPHLYDYEEHGGTAASSEKLGVDEHFVIKTLVMEDERKNPLIVLMHGDMEVSTKELARVAGVKSVSPCSPETASKHSGYIVGGTSPFGTKRKMPVYAERTIFQLEKIFINGGKRGFLVSIDPNELLRILNPLLVDIGLNHD